MPDFNTWCLRVYAKEQTFIAWKRWEHAWLVESGSIFKVLDFSVAFFCEILWGAAERFFHTIILL